MYAPAILIVAAVLATGCKVAPPASATASASSTSGEVATTTSSTTGSSEGSTYDGTWATSGSGTTCPEDAPEVGTPCAPDLLSCDYDDSWDSPYLCACGAWSGNPGPYPECHISNPCCPEGEKCSVVNHQGEQGIHQECVPLVAEPKKKFEPCTILDGDGDSPGPDDCDDGLVCAYGYCWDLCFPDGETGGPLACPGDEFCSPLYSVNSPGWGCFVPCDPLDPVCPEGLHCTGEGIFSCWPYVGEPGQGEPCEKPFSCGPGLRCVTECPSDSATECCMPLCDLTLPGACGEDKLTCAPVVPPDKAWPGQEHVGVCKLVP